MNTCEVIGLLKVLHQELPVGGHRVFALVDPPSVREIGLREPRGSFVDDSRERRRRAPQGYEDEALPDVDANGGKGVRGAVEI